MPSKNRDAHAQALKRLFAVALAFGVVACRDARSVTIPFATPAADPGDMPAVMRERAPHDGGSVQDGADDVFSGGEPWSPPSSSSGGPLTPFFVPFLEGRTAFVILPSSDQVPARLLAGLHGVCTPPAYTCGSWKRAAAAFGAMVCPTGNAVCTTDAPGNPTWEEPFAKIDEDLERSIAKVDRRFPGRVTRDGQVLTGYSRGAYAAIIISIRHPGRWPLLIVNEADVELTLPMVRAAKIRAVAFIAGEWGAELAGERRTADSLIAAGFPARLWIMPQAGHRYSANIDDIMREALAFVVAHDHDG